jgi:intracellular septation protein
MRVIFDFALIVLFFIAYKVWGIFTATAVIMAGSCFQVVFHRWYTGKWDKFSLRLALIVCFLGAATLIFHNGIFIKWKPTIAYWIFSVLFLSTQWLGKAPFLRTLLGGQITLPDFAWKKLNLAWGLFFLFLGGLNVYVLYNYSTDAWVYFKLVGCISLSVVFMILQSIYMVRYMPKQEVSS